MFFSVTVSTTYVDNVSYALEWAAPITTSVGDGRMSVMGVVNTRYGVSQPGADAER